MIGAIPQGGHSLLVHLGCALTIPTPLGTSTAGCPWSSGSFLAIPHYVVLAFLALGAVIAVVVAWFAILFTNRYPRPLFNSR